MPSPKFPKGFASYDVRRELGERICKMIDSYSSDVSSDEDGDASNVDRWERADDVYHEAVVLSSLSFIDDAEPYNIAILPQRVDGIVSTVCGNITTPDPYFLFKSPGQSADTLEGLQQTVHYALDIARFDNRIRHCALQAALKGRGVLRLRYETINTGLLADWEDVDTMANDEANDPVASEKGEVERPVSGGEVRYSGLVIDVYKPEDMVCYPTWAVNMVNMTLVGNRFIQRHQDILTKQEMGRYFSDANVTLTNDTDSIIENPMDYGQLCYDVLVKIKPGDGESLSSKYEAWYRATILKSNRELLALEPYDLPTPWYFGPGLKTDIDRWWPKRSVADRLIEIQTIYNDAWTLIILATAACAFQNVAVAGYSGQQQTIRSGLGNFIFFRGSPSFTPIPSGFTPQGVTWLIENIERAADAIARFSQVGLGANPDPHTTATATAASVQGQNQGSEDYTAEFGLELERMADSARFLLHMNWDAFYEFHGKAITLLQVDDLIMRCQVEINGKSPADAPQAALAKIDQLIDTLQKLGIQPLPSSRMVNLDALADAVLNVLNLQSSTSKILQEVQDPNVPQDPNAPGGIPPAQAGPGQDAGNVNGFPVDPQSIQNVLAGLKAKLAAGAMAGGAGGPVGTTPGPVPPGPMGPNVPPPGAG